VNLDVRISLESLAGSRPQASPQTLDSLSPIVRSDFSMLTVEATGRIKRVSQDSD